MSLSTLTLPDSISFIPIAEWENRHQNFRVAFAKDACFNMRLPFDFSEHEKNYKAVTKNFQWLKNMRLKEVYACVQWVADGLSQMLQWVMV